MVNEIGGRAGQSGVMEAKGGKDICDKCSWQVQISTKKHLFGLVTW